jgi:uncharacterized membrane protein
MSSPYSPPTAPVTDPRRAPPTDPSLVTWTHLIYALHAASIVIGVLSAAFILTAFISGLPSIVAVILNYIKRSDVRGTFLDSHFSWQIRTFWFALLWFVVGAVLWAVLAIVLIGFVIGPLVMIVTGLWVVYRIARGWLALKSGDPVPS